MEPTDKIYGHNYDEMMINFDFRIVQVNIAVIALLIGRIGITNSMLGTITERTGKVGLRKSIGAKHHGILLPFMIEFTTISVIDGCPAILLGNLAA